jgi:plastocyanin
MPLIFRMFPLSGALLLVVACGAPPATAPPPAAQARRVDPATSGSLSGKVTLVGARPAVERLRMMSDAACVESAGPNPQSDAVLVAADGALKNVFVYVKSGIDPAYVFDAPATTVELDQKGCRYSPRVLGVQTGQTVEAINSDHTLHNVHALPMANREFNYGLKYSERMSRTFSVPEVMVRFKCDVHNWMAAWVGVVSHPFFAVTSDDGTFSLKTLPPGTYTVEAWHEKFGTRSATVTIAAGQTQSTTFEFTSTPGPS